MPKILTTWFMDDPKGFIFRQKKTNLLVVGASLKLASGRSFILHYVVKLYPDVFCLILVVKLFSRFIPVHLANLYHKGPI